MKLEKAMLTDIEFINQPNNENHIKFMFNPNELSFSRSMSIEQSSGSRTNSGGNKPSFKHPNPYSLTINNIVLDSYETGENIVNAQVSKFKRGVDFIEYASGKNKKNRNKRPPIYLFSWGKNRYMWCFVKKFDCKLSLFLPDGTPVRATVNLSLEQVDVSNPPKNQGVPKVSANLREEQSRTMF